MKRMGILGMALLATWLVGPAATARTNDAAPLQDKPKQHSLRLLVHGVKKKVGAQDGLNLRARVQWQGPKAEFTYRWSSEMGPALPYGTSRDGETLVVPPGELDEGSSYQLLLKVVAKWPDPEEEGVMLTAEATSQVSFVVNAPPSGGDCTMDVSFKGPMQAFLKLSAPSWSDDDKMQYKFMLLRNGKSFVAHNWSRASSYSLGSLAKPKDELQAKCLIRDDYGSISEKLSDKVTRPQ